MARILNYWEKSTDVLKRSKWSKEKTTDDMKWQARKKGRLRSSKYVKHTNLEEKLAK